MPVTQFPTSTTTGSSPFSSMIGGNGSGGMPSLNLPGISMPNVNAGGIKTDPNQVYSFLSSPQQSLTSLIGPLLQQVFGAQGNMAQGMFAQQGAQGAARAQSDAMARGLTGSSIEAANMSGAYNSADQGFNQYIMQMLSQLVPQYTQAAQFDINGANNQYSNLAQAVGQQYSSQIQQDQFMKMLQQGTDIANQQSSDNRMGAWLGLAGSAMGAGAKMYAASDIRLKTNIEKIGECMGLPVYTFRYVKDAPFRLPDGKHTGFMGHEVAKLYPDCVTTVDGYLMVDYAGIFRRKN